LPQALLPVIPDGATAVNNLVSILQENGQWTYFYGLHPVFAHEERDRRSFRMFTAQLIERGMCRQVDIVRTFGVSSNSVKRSVKKYRKEAIALMFRWISEDLSQKPHNNERFRIQIDFSSQS